MARKTSTVAAERPAKFPITGKLDSQRRRAVYAWLTEKIIKGLDGKGRPETELYAIRDDAFEYLKAIEDLARKVSGRTISTAGISFLLFCESVGWKAQETYTTVFDSLKEGFPDEPGIPLAIEIEWVEKLRPRLGEVPGRDILVEQLNKKEVRSEHIEVIAALREQVEAEIAAGRMKREGRVSQLVSFTNRFLAGGVPKLEDVPFGDAMSSLHNAVMFPDLARGAYQTMMGEFSHQLKLEAEEAKAEKEKAGRRKLDQKLIERIDSLLAEAPKAPGEKVTA